ncbi:MAG: hypothetical protein ACPGO5_03615 [Patescibacteria group bacterium]
MDMKAIIHGAVLNILKYFSKHHTGEVAYYNPRKVDQKLSAEDLFTRWRPVYKRVYKRRASVARQKRGYIKSIRKKHLPLGVRVYVESNKTELLDFAGRYLFIHFFWELDVKKIAKATRESILPEIASLRQKPTTNNGVALYNDRGGFVVLIKRHYIKLNIPKKALGIERMAFLILDMILHYDDLLKRPKRLRFVRKQA